MQDTIEDIYPLSPLQQGMLFHSLYAPDSGIYRIQLVITLSGLLQEAALRQAWQEALDATPILRTAFIWEDLQAPVQVVCRDMELPWENQDWRGLASEEQAQRLDTWLQADRERGYELSAAPLLRLTLIKLDDKTCHLIWSHHHLLLDGWSVALVLKDVFSRYMGLMTGQPPVIAPRRPFREYIAWLQQYEPSGAEPFWRERVGGVTTPTPLRVDQLAPYTRGEPLSREHVLQLSPELTEALQSLARGQQLTLNTLVQGAWAVLLSRYSGEAEVIFGVTVSGRSPDLPGLEAMIGLFINTLPLRVAVPAESPVLPWLHAIQEQQGALSRYETTPLVQIQGWSGVPRGVALFESILVFENYPVDAALEGQPAGLSLQNLRFIEQTNYPLALAVKPGRRLSMTLTYDARRFPADTIERMLGHMETVLAGIATNPGANIGALPLLSDGEHENLLSLWNATAADYPAERCCQHLFERQAALTPDVPAVVAEDGMLTYGELNLRANQLAHGLRRRGVGPDVLVGLCCERSCALVVGILGILKAGGAYVPLDPTHPADRLAFTLADAQVSVLITQQRLLNSFTLDGAQPGGDHASGSPLTVLCLDRDWPTLTTEPAQNPESVTTPSSLAYVIYTSGSTGQPKGAMIEHRSVLNLDAGLTRAIYDQQPQRPLHVSLNAALSFDASVQQLTALLHGHTLYLIPEAVRRDGAALLSYVREHRLDILDCVPSQLRLLLAAGLLDGAGWAPGAVLAGGEAIDAATWEILAQAPATEFYNLYGPTECTVDATTTAVRKAPARPTIGRPLANVRLYVLDPLLRPVPVGVPGELYIGGPGLARGYWNRPELTAERFIGDPFSGEPGARLYRTGDQVRYLPEGNIEFLGRLDHQVKLRGFRIELGEIEALLQQHQGVREAVAAVREDRPGDQRLVGYLLAAQGAAPSTAELRAFLGQKLPEHMVPSAFVVLERWPLTPSGKVDRRALPAPDRTAAVGAVAYLAPRTSLEATLAEHWAEVLGLSQIGITDNFFALGGHSLLVTRLIARVRATFGVDIPLRSLFEAPTVEQLAMVIVQRQIAHEDEEQALAVLAQLEQLPDDEVQRILAL